MAHPPQPLQRILATEPTVAAWDARRRHEEALTGIVRCHLPRPLAERIHVADARGGELLLVADAGAVAAVVRQRTPDLLSALQRKGWEFTGIRVRVQVRVDAPRRKKVLANPIDRSALQPLAGLARDLPAGPLKAAIARFLRRVG